LNWFIICFGLTIMRLSLSYYSGYMFDSLTYVDLSCFFKSFFNLFFLFFIICFYLLYIGLYRPHDPSYGFGKLTRVNSSYFYCSFVNLIYFQLHSLILSLLEIEFYNLFWFFFCEVIMISWPRILISKWTWVDPNWFNIFPFQYL
jgi:hypothetical protein